MQQPIGLSQRWLLSEVIALVKDLYNNYDNTVSKIKVLFNVPAGCTFAQTLGL